VISVAFATHPPLPPGSDRQALVNSMGAPPLFACSMSIIPGLFDAETLSPRIGTRRCVRASSCSARVRERALASSPSGAREPRSSASRRRASRMSDMRDPPSRVAPRASATALVRAREAAKGARSRELQRISRAGSVRGALTRMPSTRPARRARSASFARAGDATSAEAKAHPVASFYTRCVAVHQSLGHPSRRCTSRRVLGAHARRRGRRTRERARGRVGCAMSRPVFGLPFRHRCSIVIRAFFAPAAR
jgi:hypothetical protein